MTAFLLDAPFADIAMQEGAVMHRGATLAWWHRRGVGRRWIVLLHGAGIDHRVFAHQVAAFAPDDEFSSAICVRTVAPRWRNRGVWRSGTCWTTSAWC